MPDALQKIRTDLGNDAVILNTKEIRSGGFLGLFAKKKIEVIAATDTFQPTLTNQAASIPKSGGTGISKPQPAKMNNPYGAAMSMAQTQVAVLDEAPNHKPAQEPIPFESNKHREDALLEEIKQMKEMMFKLAQQHKETAKLPPALQYIEERLLQQEVDPLIVHQLLERVQEEASGQGIAEVTESFAVQSVRKQLKEMLTGSQSKNIASDTKIAHFVGPTGVGKTTTIAKLAAEQVLKYKRKVGFITSDTYRIAAVEQLKTYATILNVPLEVVFSPLDLNKAFKQLEDRDIIFMDTAGRNFRNEMYVSELNSLLQANEKSETFLVLSLTTKYKDMKVIASNFTKFKLDKVLFTKMDETDSYGSILNLIRDFGFQLSYVTNGQSVPDDIIEVREEQIIDLLLEGTHQ
jgi:flagellar biosynthesis protein FlhF